VSSTVPIDHQILKAEDKVLSLCKALEATVYINPIGGTELYQRAVFAEQHIDLQFLKANPLVYPQFKHEFVPWLSILDVMMFNTVETIRAHLEDGYTIVTN